MKLTAVRTIQFELAERQPSLLKQAASYLKNCVEVRKQRDQLAELSDEQLADIGITRAQAENEANRTFTDLPTGLEPNKRIFKA